MSQHDQDLVVQMAADLAEIRAGMAALLKSHEEIRGTVYGNGTPGLKIRVDRVERFQSVVKWFMGAAAVAVVGAVADHFLGGK